MCAKFQYVFNDYIFVHFFQAQRQIITTIAQKSTSNLTKTVVTSGKPPVTIPPPPPKIQTVNNLAIKPVLNNSFAPKALKTVTAMNRSSVQIQQQQKTIKTLSPGSPQPGFTVKPPGIKTLSPSMVNHFPVAGGRVGIKTLGPQKPPANNWGGNMGPKPNYIGKHASQAQKMQQHHKNAAAKPHRNTAQQRVNYALLSPTKNNNQKAATQSNYNQALTAQILQSLPSAGATNTSKMYPLQ